VIEISRKFTDRTRKAIEQVIAKDGKNIAVNARTEEWIEGILMEIFLSRSPKLTQIG
jgi:hypothetical protein